VLFRLAANAVLGAFLAGFFACSLGSALRVLGRWICGEGSFVEGAGGAIVESTKGFLLTVSPLFILLFKVRMFEHAIFVVNEAKDKVLIDWLKRLLIVLNIVTHMFHCVVKAIRALTIVRFTT
jgi:hypothetical protein